MSSRFLCSGSLATFLLVSFLSGNAALAGAPQFLTREGKADWETLREKTIRGCGKIQDIDWWLLAFNKHQAPPDHHALYIDVIRGFEQATASTLKADENIVSYLSYNVTYPLSHVHGCAPLRKLSYATQAEIDRQFERLAKTHWLSEHHASVAPGDNPHLDSWRRLGKLVNGTILPLPDAEMRDYQKYWDALWPDSREQMGLRASIAAQLKASSTATRSAVKDLVSMMDIRLHSGLYVSMKSHWRTLYVDPLLRSTIAILDRDLARLVQTNVLPKEEIWELALRAANTAGLRDAKQAARAALLILGTTSTRGTALQGIFEIMDAHPLSTGVTAALGRIVSAINYLDLLANQQGRTFAYATQLGIPRYHTPYHFWLPALLSYELTKRGHNALAAVEANYVTALAYEEYSNVTTNVGRMRQYFQAAFALPFLPLFQRLNQRSFDQLTPYYIEFTRKDIVAAVSGAAFGASVAGASPPVELLKPMALLAAMEEGSKRDIAKGLHKSRLWWHAALGTLSVHELFRGKISDRE